MHKAPWELFLKLEETGLLDLTVSGERITSWTRLVPPSDLMPRSRFRMMHGCSRATTLVSGNWYTGASSGEVASMAADVGGCTGVRPLGTARAS